MEKVFLLMWLSDVVGSIGYVGMIATVLLGVSLLVIGIAGAAGGEPEFLLYWVKGSKWLFVIVFVAVIVPSQRSVQLMALSSASEGVVSTAIGAKGIQALNSVLDRIIQENTKSEK